jgi:DNA-directed RNA polymerase subunit RPC12/RpoP
MSVVRCPHCGAKNFTIESWEDLDRCSSCGKPLGEEGSPMDAGRGPAAGSQATEAGRGEGGDAREPPSA